MEENINQFSSNNQGYNNEGVFRIRLNTNEVFKEIETFLTGVAIDYIRDENDNIIPIEKVIGKPKANKRGIQAILQNIRAIFNNQTVQGNLKNEKFEKLVTEIHYGMNDLIFANQYSFEIDDDDTDAIINQIMYLVQLFLSRTIDNGERESYNNTMRTVESSRIQEENKFKLPFTQA